MYDSGGARSPSRSSGSRHAQTQNIATQQHIATSIRKAERDQLRRLRGASISTPQLCRAALPHSLQGGGGPPPQASRAGALTWSWPGSSPGCCGRTAGWLSSCLCPPCRRAISPPLAPLCSRPADTWEVRRCCDRVLPSQTVGKIETQQNLAKMKQKQKKYLQDWKMCFPRISIIVCFIFYLFHCSVFGQDVICGLWQNQIKSIDCVKFRVEEEAYVSCLILCSWL